MELNKIKEKLDKKEYDFFYNLQEQIELPLYFFGSITRSDFMKGKSDFDIEVFSENITSTKYKVDYLLNYLFKKREPKYMVFKINDNPISAYKYYFQNEEIHFDFFIYKKESQKLLLYYQKNVETNITFAFSICLFIIKYLHYYLGIIDDKQYLFIKNKLWVLYNPQKPAAEYYDNEEYARYLDSENGHKKYLI